jgi:hypothetical protein
VTELAVLQVVQSEPEAEVIRGLLRSEGIPSYVQQTSMGAGAAGGLAGAAGGAREILVDEQNLAAARAVLDEQSASS